MPESKNTEQEELNELRRKLHEMENERKREEAVLEKERVRLEKELEKEREELQKELGKAREIEAELRRERARTEPRKSQWTRSRSRLTVIDILNDSADQVSRISRGLIIAGLESLAVMSDATRTFVNKVAERNCAAEDMDTATNLIISLPWDIAEASLEAIDQYVLDTARVVDKFCETYKEEKYKAA